MATLPFNFSDINSASTAMSNDQAKQIVQNALASAQTYLQGMKTMAGGQPDVPMKTMARERMDLDALINYYNAQGKVAPAVSTDPSGDIRRLGEMWSATKDPKLRNLYHQQALSLAQNAGWLKPGETVASVNSLPQMTAAGTPNMDSIKLRENLKQQEIENQQKNRQLDISALNAGGSSSPDGSLKTSEIKKRIDEYIAEVAEKRKTANDARAQLERDRENLKNFVGLTDADILTIQQYIEKWDADGRYGYNYKPKNQ